MAEGDWDITDPSNAVVIGNLPEEIRDVKIQTAFRIDKEHKACATSEEGGEHLEGSAKAFYESTEPTTRPGGAALDSDDAGRLWVDSDDDSLWFYSGSDFVELTLSGGVAGAGVVLLAGRNGGQVINGGTAATDDLTLQATAHVSPTGTHAIIVTAAQTSEFNFNDVPIKGGVLGDDLNGTSTDGEDGFQIKGIDAATAAHDVLTKGMPQITATELTTSGTIGQFAHGEAVSVAEEEKSVDIGFNPDFILAWSQNVGGEAKGFWMWSSMNVNANWDMYKADQITSNLNLTVSTSTVAFPYKTAESSLNRYVASVGGYTFRYIAMKFNATQKNPT